MFQSSSAVPADYTTPASHDDGSDEVKLRVLDDMVQAHKRASGSAASAPDSVLGRVAMPCLLADFCKCAGRTFAPAPYEPQTLQLFSPGKQHLRLSLPASSADLLGERQCVDEYNESVMLHMMGECGTKAVEWWNGGCRGGTLTVTLTSRKLRAHGLLSTRGYSRRGGVIVSDVMRLKQALELCCKLRLDHDTRRKCDESGQRLDRYREERFSGISLLSGYEPIRSNRGLEGVRLHVSATFIDYLLATGSMSRRHPAGFVMDYRIFALRRTRGGRSRANHLWRIARWAIVQLNLHATDLAHGQTDDPICHRLMDNLLDYCPELRAQLGRYSAAHSHTRQLALVQKLLHEVGEALNITFTLGLNSRGQHVLTLVHALMPQSRSKRTSKAGKRTLEAAKPAPETRKITLEAEKPTLEAEKPTLAARKSTLEKNGRRATFSNKRKNHRRGRS